MAIYIFECFFLHVRTILGIKKQNKRGNKDLENEIFEEIMILGFKMLRFY